MGILISKATSNKIATQPSPISDAASQLSSEIASRPNSKTIESIRSSIPTSTSEVSINAKALCYKQLPENIRAVAGGHSIKATFADSKLPSVA